MVTVLALLSLGLVQQGPWNNDLMVRQSIDGKPFGDERVMVKSAGVPSLASDGLSKVTAAFQWFGSDNRTSFDRVATCSSSDEGKTWTKPSTIVMQEFPEDMQRPFDPTLVSLGKGKYRLYFTSSKGQGQTGIYSAVSSDCIHFRFEPGARLAVEDRRVIDCAVVQHGGKWHMTAPIGRPEEGAYHAESTDGLTFTRLPDIPSVNRANWTGNLVTAEKGVCFYGGSERGVWWSYTTDLKKWTEPTHLNVDGGDPAVVGVGKTNLLVYVSKPRF